MKTTDAVVRLAALGQETRLSIFRLLMQAGEAGLSAGVIGERLNLAPATLSFHLAHLARAGLILGRQESRFIYYTADYAGMDALLEFLTRNCCNGNNCLPQVSAAMSASTLISRQRLKKQGASKTTPTKTR
jgi:DNA-binding transcriptional ArsR family regulator